MLGLGGRVSLDLGFYGRDCVSVINLRFCTRWRYGEKVVTLGQSLKLTYLILFKFDAELKIVSYVCNLSQILNTMVSYCGLGLVEGFCNMYHILASCFFVLDDCRGTIFSCRREFKAMWVVLGYIIFK